MILQYYMIWYDLKMMSQHVVDQLSDKLQELLEFLLATKNLLENWRREEKVEPVQFEWDNIWYCLTGGLRLS